MDYSILDRAPGTPTEPFHNTVLLKRTSSIQICLLLSIAPPKPISSVLAEFPEFLSTFILNYGKVLISMLMTLLI